MSDKITLEIIKDKSDEAVKKINDILVTLHEETGCNFEIENYSIKTMQGFNYEQIKIRMDI